MTAPLATFRSLVSDAQDRRRFPELGVVTQLFPKSSDVELLRANVAVGRLGLAALPRVGDLVLVVFVDGDLNAPIVVGSLYDHLNHPPTADANEVVYEVPDAAASGVRRLHVALPSGATVTLDDDTLSVVFGGTSVEVKRDGDVTVKSAANVTVQSAGDLSLEAQGNVSIKAQGQLQIAGATVAVEGQATASLKAAQVSVGGLTQFSPS